MQVRLENNNLLPLWVLGCARIDPNLRFLTYHYPFAMYINESNSMSALSTSRELFTLRLTVVNSIIDALAYNFEISDVGFEVGYNFAF